jgi:putative transposase
LNTADHTVQVLEKLTATARVPKFVRIDNGTELTAHASRDWCRFVCTKTAYVEPESPSENPFIESFNARLRDELLDLEIFDTLLEPRNSASSSPSTTTTAACTRRSALGARRSALEQKTPAEFAALWRENRTRCSMTVDSLTGTIHNR